MSLKSSYSFSSKERRFSFIILFNVILIIFIFVVFLPSAVEYSRGFPVSLPHFIGSEPIEKQQISVSITKDGLLYIDGEKISLNELKSILAKKNHSQVLVKVDKRASVGDLTVVWETLSFLATSASV